MDFNTLWSGLVALKQRAHTNTEIFRHTYTGAVLKSTIAGFLLIFLCFYNFMIPHGYLVGLIWQNYQVFPIKILQLLTFASLAFGSLHGEREESKYTYIYYV